MAKVYIFQRGRPGDRRRAPPPCRQRRRRAK